MNKILIVLAILVIAAQVSCGYSRVRRNSKVVTITKNYAGFTGITVNGKGIITIKQSDAYRFVVKADENDLSAIDVSVKKGFLHITYIKKLGSDFIPEFTIELPQLNFIALQGSAIVKSDNVIHGEQLIVEASGHSACELYVAVNNLSMNLRGKTICALNGTGNIANFTLAGKSIVRAFDFATKKAYISITGSGKTDISVEELLDVTISGHGNVTYSGMPKITMSINGTGKVEARKHEPARNKSEASGT